MLLSRSIMLSLAALALFAGGAFGEPVSTKAVDRCIANLKGEKMKARAVRLYCRCMAESIEEADMISYESQTAMERSFPPVHQDCHKKAGWR